MALSGGGRGPSGGGTRTLVRHAARTLSAPAASPRSSLRKYFGSVSEVELDHVQIAAPEGCEEAARAWFGGLLALEEIEKPERLRERGGAWFALGERQLHIGVEKAFAPARKAHVALRVGAAELDRLAERLAAAGSPVIWDDALPGERRFYSADPWGNRIEFLAAEAQST